MVGSGDCDGRAARTPGGQSAQQRNAERGALRRVRPRAHLIQHHQRPPIRLPPQRLPQKLDLSCPKYRSS